MPLLISRCYVPYPRRHWRAAWKGYVFKKDLEGLFIDRMEQNEEITAKFMNDEAFQEIVRRHLLKEVYQQIRGETEVEKRPE